MAILSHRLVLRRGRPPWPSRLRNVAVRMLQTCAVSCGFFFWPSVGDWIRTGMQSVAAVAFAPVDLFAARHGIA